MFAPKGYFRRYVGSNSELPVNEARRVGSRPRGRPCFRNPLGMGRHVGAELFHGLRTVDRIQ